MTFTRGTAKSFTEILALMLKCIMYPGTHLFICAPTKYQAASIAKENIEKIWEFYPLLKGEVKKFWFNIDDTKLLFHNNSKLDVVQMSESARGGRRNGGSIEEIVDPKMDKDTLNSVVIPLMANDRIAECGGVDPNEKHKSQFYITTAGNKQSYAYEKMKEVLLDMGMGRDAFCLGAGYELPCMHGQLDIDFISELKEQITFNALSFAREYESVWTGTSDNSLVQLEDVNMTRVIKKAEFKHCGDKNAEYVLSYDVARAEGSQNANCALVVLKITPRSDGTYQKHLVNVFSFEGTHFYEQAKFLKQKVEDYKARVLVIDSNGAGKGLVDVLITDIDENPPYSVINDDRYNKYKTPDSIPMIYSLSSNSKENKASDIHNVFINTISTNKVKMLVSEIQARQEIDKKIKDSEGRSKATLPYVMTDLLCEEIMNLEYKQQGNSTQVKQISRSINKDKFSAFEYGIYYIYTLEMSNQKRKRETIDVSQFFAVKSPVKRNSRW